MNLKSDFLQGKTVLIMREESGAQDICKKVSIYGGVPIIASLLSFGSSVGTEKEQATRLIKNVNEYDWLIFTSKNGVDYFFRFLKELEMTLETTVKVAVIGKKTFEIVQAYGVEPAFSPSVFVSEDFLVEFLREIKKDERVLICKGNKARTIISDGLKANGNKVDEAIVYVTEQPLGAESALVEAFRDQVVDVLLFTSTSSVEAFYRVAVKYGFLDQIEKSIIVSIGPTTRSKIEVLGLGNPILPKEYTLDGMLNALAFHLK